MKQQYYSPLRYPGGKGKLLQFVKDLVVHNGLEDGSYSEPFAGGASVALGLLLDDFVSEIHINDIDEGIYSFWFSVLQQTDDFLKKIWETPLTVEEWRRQLYIHKNKSDFPMIDVGFSTFFLNRTNRSGIVSAGVIGGIDQNGNYKIDARFNKDGLAKRIIRIANCKDQINVYKQDALDFITKTLPANKTKGLIFLDPPYYVKGKRLYTNFYEHEDHEKVASAIKSSPHKHWIVTYDSADQIDEIYDLKNQITYNLRYSLSHRSSAGSEFLFYSDSVELPYHPNDGP